MPKYHNKKIIKDGMVFDSVKEYRRWLDLSLIQKAGKITELQRQVVFPLVPAHYEHFTDEKTGKKKRRCVERACDYIADFVYIDRNGEKIVEDTKGFKTREYVIKRKLMLHIHGIKIREI